MVLFCGLLLCYVPQVVAGHMHDCNCRNALDGDDDAEALLDMLDDARHPGVGAVGYLGLHTGLEGEVEVVEEDDVVAPLGRDPDEVLHHAVGHIEGLVVGGAALGHGAHDVAQGLVECQVAAYLHQVVVGAADKDDVVDGRHQPRAAVLGAILHRNVRLAHLFFLVEAFLHRHQARRGRVPHPERVPV